ncbi:MAG: type I-E CRISPR-associated endoribonuclease Cas2 [Chloroflexi bacterium]|nr:type I-E CRISPR-associated endoribonuclease Cas2 [Chloroflexota bacterium]
MVVIILEKVPKRLRGELTRWLLELKAGVFVGDVSAMVRDRLWEKACRERGEGGAILVHNTDNEQGFALRMHGDTGRLVEDFEGLSLVRLPPQG